VDLIERIGNILGESPGDNAVRLWRRGAIEMIKAILPDVNDCLKNWDPRWKFNGIFHNTVAKLDGVPVQRGPKDWESSAIIYTFAPNSLHGKVTVEIVVSGEIDKVIIQTGGRVVGGEKIKKDEIWRCEALLKLTFPAHNRKLTSQHFRNISVSLDGTLRHEMEHLVGSDQGWNGKAGEVYRPRGSQTENNLLTYFFAPYEIAARAAACFYEAKKRRTTVNKFVKEEEDSFRRLVQAEMQKSPYKYDPDFDLNEEADKFAKSLFDYIKKRFPEAQWA
jgi:hypothetical protein